MATATARTMSTTSYPRRSDACQLLLQRRQTLLPQILPQMLPQTILHTQRRTPSERFARKRILFFSHEHEFRLVVKETVAFIFRSLGHKLRQCSSFPLLDDGSSRSDSARRDDVNPDNIRRKMRPNGHCPSGSDTGDLEKKSPSEGYDFQNNAARKFLDENSSRTSKGSGFRYENDGNGKNLGKG